MTFINFEWELGIKTSIPNRYMHRGSFFTKKMDFYNKIYAPVKSLTVANAI
jgi:hypothetical protein